MRLPGEILQGILARAALALLRVHLGAVFLIAALPKLHEDFTPGLTAFIQGRAAMCSIGSFSRLSCFRMRSSSLGW
jgi:hypothetical protein